MRIDAHQHFWNLERGDYGWLSPEEPVLYRNYGPSDLRLSLRENGVDQTVLVQAAPTVAETEYLLDLCDRTPFVAGVVGWLDFESASFKADLEHLLSRPGLVGLRPMIQDIPEANWMLRPVVMENIQRVMEKGLALDLLVMPHHLPYVLSLLERIPALHAVIDHIAKPHIGQHVMEPWRTQMTDIAAFPSVYCKLSGMVTEADHAHWEKRDLAPYVDHVLKVFGSERVMFGSDWPVCLLAASYTQVFQTLVDLLPKGLSDASFEDVLGNNAARFYGLNNRNEG